MAKRRRRVPRYLRAELEARNRPEIPEGGIPADLSQQAPNNSYSPRLYYLDREFTCRDCGSPQFWTAEQQKWWYEVAKGPIDSVAIRCRACRNARRDTQRGTPRRSHGDRNPPPIGGNPPS